MNAIFSEKYVKEKLNRLEKANAQKRQKVQEATHSKKPQMSRSEYEKYKKILFEENKKPQKTSEEDINVEEISDKVIKKEPKNVAQQKEQVKRAISPKRKDIPQTNTAAVTVSQNAGEIIIRNTSPKPVKAGEIVFSQPKRSLSKADSKTSQNSSQTYQRVDTSPPSSGNEKLNNNNKSELSQIVPKPQLPQSRKQGFVKQQTTTNTNNRDYIQSDQIKVMRAPSPSNSQKISSPYQSISNQRPPHFKQQYQNTNDNRQYLQQDHHQLSQDINRNYSTDDDIQYHQYSMEDTQQYSIENRSPYNQSNFQTNQFSSFNPNISKTSCRTDVNNQQYNQIHDQKNHPPVLSESSSPSFPIKQNASSNQFQSQASRTQTDNFIQSQIQNGMLPSMDTPPNQFFYPNNYQQQQQHQSSLQSNAIFISPRDTQNSQRSNNFVSCQSDRFVPYQLQQQIHQTPLQRNLNSQNNQIFDTFPNEESIYSDRTHLNSGQSMQQFQSQQKYDERECYQQNQIQYYDQSKQQNQLMQLGVTEDVEEYEAKIAELKCNQINLKKEREQLCKDLKDLDNKSKELKTHRKSKSIASNSNNNSSNADSSTFSLLSFQNNYLEASFKKQQQQPLNNDFINESDEDELFERQWEHIEKEEEELEKSFVIISDYLNMQQNNSNKSKLVNSSSHRSLERPKSQISTKREEEDMGWLDGIEDSFCELKSIDKNELIPLLTDVQQQSNKKSYLTKNSADKEEDTYTKLKNQILGSTISNKKPDILLKPHQVNSLFTRDREKAGEIIGKQSGELVKSSASPQFGTSISSRQSFLNESDSKGSLLPPQPIQNQYVSFNQRDKAYNQPVLKTVGNKQNQFIPDKVERITLKKSLPGEIYDSKKKNIERDRIFMEEGDEEIRQQEYIAKKLNEMEAEGYNSMRSKELQYSETTSSYNALQSEYELKKSLQQSDNFFNYGSFNATNKDQAANRLFHKETKQLFQKQQEDDLQVSDLNNYNSFRSELQMSEQQQQQQQQQQIEGEDRDALALSQNKNISFEKEIEQIHQGIEGPYKNKNSYNKEENNFPCDYPKQQEKATLFNKISDNQFVSKQQTDTQIKLEKKKIADKPFLRNRVAADEQNDSDHSSGDELEKTIKMKLKKKEDINSESDNNRLNNIFNKLLESNQATESQQKQYQDENVNNGNSNNRDLLLQQAPSEMSHNTQASTKDKISNIQSKLNSLFNKKKQQQQPQEIQDQQAHNLVLQSQERVIFTTQSRDNYDLPKQEPQRKKERDPESQENKLGEMQRQQQQQLFSQQQQQQHQEQDQYQQSLLFDGNNQQQLFSSQQQQQQLPQQGSRIDRRVIDNLAEEVEMLMRMQNIRSDYPSSSQQHEREEENDEYELRIEDKQTFGEPDTQSLSRKSFWPKSQTATQLYEIEEEHSIDNSLLEHNLIQRQSESYN